MRLNFPRLIGPKTPTTPPPPAATPETPEQPARSGWEQYLTRDPSRSKTLENPEMSRALRPYSAGAVHDFLLAWAERAGHSLTEEQSAGIVANAAAWLEDRIRASWNMWKPVPTTSPPRKIPSRKPMAEAPHPCTECRKRSLIVRDMISTQPQYFLNGDNEGRFAGNLLNALAQPPPPTEINFPETPCRRVENRNTISPTITRASRQNRGQSCCKPKRSRGQSNWPPRGRPG